MGGPSGVEAVLPATANPALPSAHEMMAQGLAHAQHLAGFDAGRNLLALGGSGCRIGRLLSRRWRSEPPPCSNGGPLTPCLAQSSFGFFPTISI